MIIRCEADMKGKLSGGFWFSVTEPEPWMTTDSVPRLISAAPDLLNAAKAIREAMVFWALDPSNKLGEARMALDAAIAKAEGEEAP